MATHTWVLPQLQPFEAKILGFQRGDSNARYLSLIQQCSHQVTKVALFVSLGVIITQVDTGEYDFLKACAHFALYMVDNRCNAAAARSPAHIRNNAISAAVIAAILHLNLSACTPRGPVTGHFWRGSAMKRERRETRRVIRPWVLFNQRYITTNMLCVKWQHR